MTRPRTCWTSAWKGSSTTTGSFVSADVITPSLLRKGDPVHGQLLEPAGFAHDPLDAEIEAAIARVAVHGHSDRGAIVDDGVDVDAGGRAPVAPREERRIAERPLESVLAELSHRNALRQGFHRLIDPGVRWHAELCRQGWDGGDVR